MEGGFEVVPAELAAAAGPLREAAAGLDDVAHQGRALDDLMSSAPTQALVEAFRDCLRAYELATWDLAEETGWLAQRLTDAAGYYAAQEGALRDAVPTLTPRADMPPLRDGSEGRLATTPQPAPAPAPAPAPVAPR